MGSGSEFCIYGHVIRSYVVDYLHRIFPRCNAAWHISPIHYIPQRSDPYSPSIRLECHIQWTILVSPLPSALQAVIVGETENSTNDASALSSASPSLHSLAHHRGTVESFSCQSTSPSSKQRLSRVPGPRNPLSKKTWRELAGGLHPPLHLRVQSLERF